MTETTAIEAYLAAVRAELDDLPDDERSDLLDDVEQHLLEVAAEAGAPLETTIGPPEQYAAELRAAAGLPARGGDDQDSVLRRLDTRISRAWPGRVVRRSAAWLDASPTFRGMRVFLPELRPGWWVLRGYLAALVIGMTTSGGRQNSLPIPTVLDNELLGLITLVLTIRASVAWGRRDATPRLRLATALGSVLLMFFAFVAVTQSSNNSQPYHETAYAYRAEYGGLIGSNGEITNIYAYSPDGKPLDVLLYDQDGRPIVTGHSEDYAEPYADKYDERRPRLPAGPHVGNLFPRPEPIIDPMTGEVIGEKSRPVVIPPSVSPSPSPTATATPSAQPTPAKPKPAKPKPTTTKR